MGCGGSPSLRAEATRELITVKKWQGKMAVGVVPSPTLVLFSAPSRRMAEWVCVFVVVGDDKHAKHGSWLDCNLSSSSGRESRRKSREEVCCVCWAEGVVIERQFPLAGYHLGHVAIGRVGGRQCENWIASGHQNSMLLWARDWSYDD